MTDCFFLKEKNPKIVSLADVKMPEDEWLRDGVFSTIVVVMFVNPFFFVVT